MKYKRIALSLLCFVFLAVALWYGRGLAPVSKIFGYNTEDSNGRTIKPLILKSGKTYGHVLEAGESSMWLESSTKYDIVSPDMNFDLINIKGKITPSFQKEDWPIGEPFQIMALTTRQKLTVTVE